MRRWGVGAKRLMMTVAGLALSPQFSIAPPVVQAADAAVSTAADSILMRALKDEMGRTLSRLRMDDLEKPYFVSYTVRDLRRTTLRCDFGGLVTSSAVRDRSLKADVRVGDAAFDNTHYVGADAWRYRPTVGDLPLEDDYDAIRFAAWSLTDDAYKAALEQLSQKRAYKMTKNITEELGDLAPETPARLRLPMAEEAFDRAEWAARLCAVSRVFRKYRGIQGSWVYMDASVENRFFVNSEGAEFVKPALDIEFQIGGVAQADDGMETRHVRRRLYRSASELPPLPRLLKEAEAFAASLSEWAKAPQQGEYVGPVLLEGAAAAEFFNQLLGHNVGNPRAPWLENEGDKKRFPSGALTTRTGRRVTAAFLDAVDDPSVREFEGVPLAGHYAVDDEGVPAQAVALVEKGRLKDVLMSRSPAKGRARSNGHGRGGFWDRPTGRTGNLIVSADGGLPGPELKKRFLDLVREAGLEYGLTVRRIAFEDEKGEEDLLAPPTEVVRVYAKDGREERVRDAEFDGVSLRALRDIVAVSAERTAYNFYERGHLQGNRGEIPASVVAPSLLVEEMEFKKTEKKPEKRPYLKHPHFE